MKNLTKKSLLFLLLFASMLSFANTEIKTNKEKELKVTVISVGKIKEKYLKDAISEYSKRLSAYCKPQPCSTILSDITVIRLLKTVKNSFP